MKERRVFMPEQVQVNNKQQQHSNAAQPGKQDEELRLPPKKPLTTAGRVVLDVVEAAKDIEAGVRNAADIQFRAGTGGLAGLVGKVIAEYWRGKDQSEAGQQGAKQK